jgi:hypothetical protein
MSEDMDGEFFRGRSGILASVDGFEGKMEEEKDHVPVATLIAYTPAVICVAIFLFKGIYLTVRGAIWPLEDVSVLPASLGKRIDRRLHFTLVPLEDDEHDYHESVIATDQSDMLDLLADRGTGVATVLKNSERDLFKTICTEIVEVMLKRHETALNRAAEVISLPSFLVQFDRIYCICVAIALNVRLRVMRTNVERDTWGKYIFGMAKDTYQMAKQVATFDDAEEESIWSGKLVTSDGRIITFDDPECPYLQECADQLKKPVSAEELHVALMLLIPKIANKKSNDEEVLGDIARSHKGILDMFCNVTWIFEKDFHARQSATRTQSAKSFAKSTITRNSTKKDSSLSSLSSIGESLQPETVPNAVDRPFSNGEEGEQKLIGKPNSQKEDLKGLRREHDALEKEFNELDKAFSKAKGVEKDQLSASEIRIDATDWNSAGSQSLGVQPSIADGVLPERSLADASAGMSADSPIFEQGPFKRARSKDGRELLEL